MKGDIEWSLDPKGVREGVLEQIHTPCRIGNAHHWLNPHSKAAWLQAWRDLHYFWVLDLRNIEVAIEGWGDIEEGGILDAHYSSVLVEMNGASSSSDVGDLSLGIIEDRNGSGKGPYR